MSRLGFALLAAVVVGCAGSEPEESAVTTGAATSPAPTEGAAAVTEASPIPNGWYDAHMKPEFYGSLQIKNSTATSLDFDFDISVEEDSPVGHLRGTATRAPDGSGGRAAFHFSAGGCELDLVSWTNGDLLVDPNSTCGLALSGLDQKVDFGSIWRPAN